MSDEWVFYPCPMGDHQAFMFVNVSIGETLDQAPETLYKLALIYQAPHADGLPTQEEFEAVSDIEDQLEAFAQSRNDWYVGRITVNGQRHFLIYINGAAQAWQEYVAQLSQESGYQFQTRLCEDPGHSQYWDFLYPTFAEWQMIRDLRVMEVLRQHGDDVRQPREIDHWAYFESVEAASLFASWAQDAGFQLREEVEQREDRFAVLLSHIGTMVLNDLTSHTIALAEKAQELGGKYDGWETRVMRPDEQNPDT